MATTSDQLDVQIALTQPNLFGGAALRFTTDCASYHELQGTLPFPPEDITRDR